MIEILWLFLAEKAHHIKCKYVYTLKPSGLTTLSLLEVSVLKMELMNLMLFLRGFILAFGYGKKNYLDVSVFVFSIFKRKRIDGEL